MIPLLLICIGWVLVAMPGIYGPAVRLRPASWTRAAAASLAVGAAAVEIGLVFLAVPSIIQLTGHHHVADMCHGLLGTLPFGAVPVGWLAAAAATLILIRAIVTLRDAHQRARSLVVEPWLGTHEDHGDFELVTLPTSQLLAMSVPGPTSQVVLSQGLVDHLGPDEVEAVIAHEACHHDSNHWRYTTLALVLERAMAPVPGVSRSTESLRTAVETWADDAAAQGSDARRAVLRRAIQRVAGADRAATDSLPFAGRVRARLSRLDRPAHTPGLAQKLAALMPLAVLVGLTIALLGGSILGVHHAAALGPNC